MRRSRSDGFVAISFWDVFCLLVIAAIFKFGVVAISFCFALCLLFANANREAPRLTWFARDADPLMIGTLAGHALASGRSLPALMELAACVTEHLMSRDGKSENLHRLSPTESASNRWG